MILLVIISVERLGTQGQICTCNIQKWGHRGVQTRKGRTHMGKTCAPNSSTHPTTALLIYRS